MYKKVVPESWDLLGESDLLIDHSMKGSKEPVIFMVRYCFGSGDTTYIVTIGSDCISYGFMEEK